MARGIRKSGNKRSTIKREREPKKNGQRTKTEDRRWIIKWVVLFVGVVLVIIGGVRQ